MLKQYWQLRSYSFNKTMLCSTDLGNKAFEKKKKMKNILTLPHNKMLDWSKLKAFADDNIDVNDKLKFCFGKV